MERDWRKILPQINLKFNPEFGKLYHTIESDKPNEIKSLRIEIETNEFEYTDPFYGEIKANKFLHEFANIEFESLDLKPKTILDLQNKTIKTNAIQIPGWFSNSLDTIIQELKFGNINSENEINCSIKYYLTKSDSYPLLLGEREDHMKFQNSINVNLSIENLLFLDKRKIKIMPLSSFLDGSVYQLNKKEIKNLVTCEEWHQYIEIELKNYTGA